MSLLGMPFPVFTSIFLRSVFMHYIKLRAQAPDETTRALIISELADLGFEAFLETDNGFEAAIEKSQFEEAKVDEVFGNYSKGNQLAYHMEEVAKENWNKLWEENFEMTEVNSELLIRAPFHEPDRKYVYEIVVMPKMSFGTGHHATTQLMLKQQMLLNHEGKRVFDAGCGTGILAIMAMKLGAAKADACDVEDWSVENAKENAAANGVKVKVGLGKAADFLQEAHYDIFLANINRNIVLEELAVYAKMLKPNGSLLLSGFYEQDVETVVNEAFEYRLHQVSHSTQNQWACLLLKKHGKAY